MMQPRVWPWGGAEWDLKAVRNYIPIGVPQAQPFETSEVSCRLPREAIAAKQLRPMAQSRLESLPPLCCRQDSLPKCYSTARWPSRESSRPARERSEERRVGKEGRY